MTETGQENEGPSLGVWLVGARGAIATSLAYGLAGLQQGLVEPTGIVTERGPFHDLGLRSFDDILLAGHEISGGDLSRTAAELARNGVLPRDLVAACSTEAAALDARIRPGVLDVADVGAAELHPDVVGLGGASQRDCVARLSDDVASFQEEHGLERVIVVYLASTEPWREEQPSWSDLAAFEAALDRGDELPASCLYAYAAFRAGAPFVNFTPNRGASIPALVELAKQCGLPHCGNDGKTGETLLKTVLAPMFVARHLRVLSWQGYNMLGNKDGASLADPIRRRSKLESKDQPLHSILDDDELHTSVGIDYVPSLHDWKTAMDFVHFQGFLGAKMSLQFTWSGSDSALASPLVIDLVRLVDFAAAQGEAGEMPHTACFFKAPIGGGTHDFHAQFQRLIDYTDRHTGRSSTNG